MTQGFTLTYPEITKLSLAGNAAPSGGNFQPWRVVFFPDRMDIFVDEKRSQSFLDVGGYASIFAIGCLVENVTQTADELGLIYTVVRHEFIDCQQPVAIISFCAREGSRRPNLAPAISRRCTNRRLADGSVLPPTQLQTLSRCIAANKKYRLHFVSRVPEKTAIAAQLGKLDGIRYLHPELFAEMMQEFKFPSEEELEIREGLDIRTLELPKNAPKLLALLNKYPKLRQDIPRATFEKFAQPLLLESSHLGCLTFAGQLTTQEMLQAGQHLERIWLQATQDNVAFQPWSIITFLNLRVTQFRGHGFSGDEKRCIKQVVQKVTQLFGAHTSESVVFVFRVSHAQPPTARSLRRNWQDYTEITFSAMME